MGEALHSLLEETNLIPSFAVGFRYLDLGLFFYTIFQVSHVHVELTCLPALSCDDTEHYLEGCLRQDVRERICVVDLFQLSESLRHEPAFVFRELVLLVQFCLKTIWSSSSTVISFGRSTSCQTPPPISPSSSRLMTVFQCGHSGADGSCLGVWIMRKTAAVSRHGC